MTGERKLQILASKRRKIESIFATVLNDVKPTEKEMRQVTAYTNEIMTRLKKIAPKDVEIISAGSVSRGTQIRGTSDIDIFLLFPRNIKEEIMERKGVEFAKKIVAKHKNESFMIKYSEHPYVKLILGDLGVNADIVPAFKITKMMLDS
jgi:tRNA nucleotidyltransferase (CCA-adding enzyme)